MDTYAVLLRGVNVGGKNKISMKELVVCLEGLGFTSVSTYIASGNVIFASDKPPAEIKSLVEAALGKNFKLDSALIKALVLNRTQLQTVVDNKPKGFGEQPEKYHSDAIFLIGVSSDEAMKVFSPKEGVDTVWPGAGVVYSQRVSSLRTKSRLNKIMSSPVYQSMTIRSWNTTTKLLEKLKTIQAD